MEDKKEIVKYNNDLNSMSFAGFGEKELDLFFTICFKLKEQGNNVVEIDFSELKTLTYLTKKPERLKSYILQLNKKLLALNHQREVRPNEYKAFVLFTRMDTNFNTNKLEVEVNPPFLYILNNLISNYTKFDLIDFVSLNSVYSKNMFKILKQWETKKEKEFTMEEFRKILTVPENYRISEIDKKILRHIMNELPKYFSNLKLEKMKTGKKVTALKFTWRGKEDIIKIEETPEKITMSQNLYNLIKEIQALTFFQNVMTPRNIEKLIKKYDEKTLIQIFKRAKDHTYQEIKSIKYFDSVCESIKTDPTIIIKPAEKIIEKEVQTYPSVEKREEIKKIDIACEEFDKKYEEYLKQFNLSDDHFVKRAFEIRYNIVEVEEKSTQEIKVFTEKDIPENKLLGKNGKKLAGMALQMRINKILKHLKRS